jgi:hypothetical protein
LLALPRTTSDSGTNGTATRDASDESELIAAAVVSDQRDAVIADSLGLSHRTYYRRKALPETQRLIAEYRREAAQQIRDGVVGAALSGLERLRRIVEDPNSSDSAAVAASRYLIDLAVGVGWVGGHRTGGRRGMRNVRPRAARSRSERWRHREGSCPAGPDGRAWRK